jgi:hypothetical protein
MSVASEEHAIASAWLSTLTQAIQSADPHAFAATLLPHGWFRDVLTFTWDVRSLHGHAAIAQYLAESGRLSAVGVTDITLTKEKYYLPKFSGPGKDKTAIEAGFDFTTRCALGRGYVHLRKDGEEWKAVTLATIVIDLKGHEEPVNVAEGWESDGRPWGEIEEDRKEQWGKAPYVLIGKPVAYLEFLDVLT